MREQILAVSKRSKYQRVKPPNGESDWRTQLILEGGS